MLTPNSILQNRYLIVRLLGKGGMGAVYEAIDQRLSCVVALKETLVGSNPEARQGFQREAALLANLRHASLPNVMDYFGEGQGEFLVMEFIAGQDLAELLVLRDGPFRESKVVRWANDILKLLEYLHTREPAIIHRDIKPANLKVTTQGEIFLLDFGLAKGAAGQMATIQNNESVYGYTPLYAPLEQIQGRGTDPRSDIYALGATLYHLLTGQPPVSAPARYEAAENDQPDPLKPANQLNFQVSPEIAALIQSAMALRRNDRFRSAAEMRVALENAARIVADRKSARQAEQALFDTLPGDSEEAPAKPLVTDKDVQFTVYTPQKIKPEKNYSVLAFAHLSKRRDDAPDDEPDPIADVKAQAARMLGDQLEDYSDAKDSSRQAVPRGGQITFVPLVPGISFSPSSRSFNWRKSVHREEFDMWATQESDGKTLNGSMTVFLGSLVIAEVALKISVDSQAAPSAERISPDRAQSARRVRQVFASYSPRDEQVVAELAHVAPMFGSRFLTDRTHLEPGEDRIAGLQRLIREADVFQLFWSTNSMRSPETVGEIKYAASLGRPGFILPTYWEEPVPRSPAEGLPPPEIDRLQFYRIYPGAISKATFGVRTGFGEKAIEAELESAAPISYAQSEDTGALLSADSPDIAQESSRVTAPIEEPRDESPTRELPPLLDTLPAPQPAFASAGVSSAPTFGTVVCSSCGMSYPAGMKFCGGCGSTLTKAKMPDPIYPAPQAVLTSPTQSFQAHPPGTVPAPRVAARKRFPMTPIYAGAAMVLLVVVIAPVAWLMMTQKAGTKSNSTQTSAPPAGNSNSNYANSNRANANSSTGGSDSGNELPTGRWAGRYRTTDDQGTTREFPMTIDFDQKTASDSECSRQGRITVLVKNFLEVDWLRCGRERMNYSIAKGILTAEGSKKDIPGENNRPQGIPRSWKLSRQ